MVCYLKALEAAALWEWQLPDQLVYKKLFIKYAFSLHYTPILCGCGVCSSYPVCDVVFHCGLDFHLLVDK